MATNFPAALDNSTSLPYPSATNDTNSPSLAGGQDNQNDAVIATQTKVGIGASAQSPIANAVLLGTGTGDSQWGSITSAYVSSGTGSGAFVFATSPTISSPTISSPTISNPTFTGSLGGITTSTITASGLITANGGATIASSLTLQSGGTLTLPNNSITASYLATSAITLGYAQITSSPANISNSLAAVSGLSVTVTIPSGGRKVEVSAYIPQTLSGAGLNLTFSLWDGTVGSGTEIATNVTTYPSSSNAYPCYISAVVTPSAGSKTYNVGAVTSTNAATITGATTSPAYILVKAI